jgi:hypothetical protein
MPTRSSGSRHKQQGQILPIFCIMLTLLLLPVAGLAVDGGLLLSSHATLVGAVQAAAEAGSQAIDVTALEQHATFQLCETPDGGADCGNGVGTVAEVVSDVISATDLSSPSNCVDEGFSPLPQALPGPSGCAFEVLSKCGSRGTQATGPVEPADGVEVVGWRTVELPLLVFPGWTTVLLRATTTSWLEHGFSAQMVEVGTAGTAC